MIKFDDKQQSSDDSGTPPTVSNSGHGPSHVRPRLTVTHQGAQAGSGGVPAADYHSETAKNNAEFHAFMDVVHPAWREWPAGGIRAAAKNWNFVKLYGIGKK